MNFKTVLFFFVLLTALTVDSFAITGKDKWRDIRMNNEILIQQPTFAGVFGPEGLFNACTTDDEFRSIKPVKNCLEYRDVIRHSERGNFRDYICVIHETKQVSISRIYKRTICSKFAPISNTSYGECLQYKTVTAVYPTKFSFAVIEGGNNESKEYLFSKTFALQSCDKYF